MSKPALIALMGETGSGKSTFINRATSSERFLVGNCLHSCTSNIQASEPFLVDGHPVVLIDTPGFNDTLIDDADVLKGIAAFLATLYEGEVKLAGVIYFHRISEERWRRSDTLGIERLKEICGEETLRNVVLATNMWGNVKPEIGQARERQLATEFVNPLLNQGAQLRRHYDTVESAHEIIRAIVNNHPVTFQVQRELVDEKRKFDRTAVGRGINREANRYIKTLEGRIKEVQSALMKHSREETRSALAAEITLRRGTIAKLTNMVEVMNVDYERKKAVTVAFLRSLAGVTVWRLILGVVRFFSA